MITREEYELLKNYRDKGYKWIVRDGDDECLYVYKLKPIKLSVNWGTVLGCSKWPVNDNSLPCVTWEDEKPTRIDDLIRDYESHQVITGGNNVNNAELVKEIEEILDDIGVSDYQLGECDEDTIWTISSITIREILSAIEKCSPDVVKVTVPQYIADWILEVKALERSFKLELLFDTTEMPDEVFDWLDERYGDTDILAKAWLDGYVVEKEKLYYIEFSENQYAQRFDESHIDSILVNDKALAGRFTEEQIKKINPRFWLLAVEVE